MLSFCECKNLRIDWKIKDFSIKPRACQCDQCLKHNAQWLSKSGSSFELSVRFNEYYQQIKHGTQTATFHFCSACNSLIAVTVMIDKTRHGAINAQFLSQRKRFPLAQNVMPNTDLPAQERLEIWRQNWCTQVEIKRPKPKFQLV